MPPLSTVSFGDVGRVRKFHSGLDFSQNDAILKVNATIIGLTVSCKYSLDSPANRA